VGTDGSETAELAVRHAAGLAGQAKARLVVVTAFVPDPHVDAPSATNIPEDLRWMLADRSQAEERARHGRELAKQAGAGEVVIQTSEGDPTDVILGAATDFNAELIVVGSKGLTSAARFIVGSVASSVSHRAPCDVLIVQTTG
jgi:nucleotide-binding universal stress UspA family protein